MLADVLFLMFAAGLLLGAGTVVLAKNPMVGVLGLVFTFLQAAMLFILLKAEFLGLLLIMVYVGAITVMFLFVLMTIDIDFGRLREGFAPYLPVGLLVAGALLAELILAIAASPVQGVGNPIQAAVRGAVDGTDVQRMGLLLFTSYNLPFQAAGLILLTAMVGAICLTHRRRAGVKRQDIGAQVLRLKKDAMVKTKPAVGQGVGIEHWTPKSVATHEPPSLKGGKTPRKGKGEVACS
jgi:NADH-quinone oxidoreductase subunit J